MRALAFIVLTALVALPAASAQETTYVRLYITPAYQYSTIEDISVPIIGSYAVGGSYGSEGISIQVSGDVQTQNWATLERGVSPSEWNYIRLGRLDAGLYTFDVQGWVGDLSSRIYQMDIEVKPPPEDYVDSLEETSNDQAKYLFKSLDNSTFKITVEGGNDKRTYLTNSTLKLDIPNVIGGVRIDVEDEHQWKNRKNPETINGRIEYLPREWNPRAEHAENVEDQLRAAHPVFWIGLAGLVVTFVWRRKR